MLNANLRICLEDSAKSYCGRKADVHCEARKRGVCRSSSGASTKPPCLSKFSKRAWSPCRTAICKGVVTKPSSSSSFCCWVGGCPAMMGVESLMAVIELVCATLFEF